jgi:hypothetical protein
MVKFNSNNPSADIVFIFLDRISRCQNTWTAELMKNLSDFVLSNILDKGFDVLQGLDEDLLLKQASDKYKYAVVLSTGTEFINGDRFFQEVKTTIKESNDFFLIGHIPDRDEGYYELHDQCYIINLEKYKLIGCPTVGEFAYYSSHVQTEPLRSKENIHDDYTPVWVKPGHILKEYKHKWHGWNILSQAFKHDLPVIVFPEQFRINKKFYYPNYEPSFVQASSYLYGKQQVAAQTLFYPYNTEHVIQVDFKGPIQQLVIQASGLQFVEYLRLYGYDENTVVRFVDYNLFALECMHEIVTNWNGENYLEFVKGYADTRTRFVNKTGDQWLTMTGQTQTVDQSLWQDILKKVKFEFRHEDLVLNLGLDISTWVDLKPNTIIHLSHIFNYDPVSTFCPLKYRILSERILLKKIQQYVPEAVVIINERVESKIDRPTWRMNGDWDGL